MSQSQNSQSSTRSRRRTLTEEEKRQKTDEERKRQEVTIDALLERTEELDEVQTKNYNQQIEDIDGADTGEPLDEEFDEEDVTTIYSHVMSKSGGSEKLRTLTNYYPGELLELWSIVKKHVLKKRGRGKKSSVAPMDRFIITLAHLKHTQQFNKLGLDFGIDQSTANTLFHETLSIIDAPLKRALRRKMTMNELRENETAFTTRPSVLVLTDVHFHKSHRPAGRFSEMKHYFSGKHKDYGLKVATVHYANGMCVHISKHEPGSVHDFAIFKKNLSSYEKILEKEEDEKSLDDNDPLSEEYPNQWSIMGDSAYTGADKHIRAFFIKKRSLQTSSDRNLYEKLSNERVLIENWYGRMLNLWGIMRKTYTYEHERYDTLFSVLASLTNYSVLKSPMRNDEGVYYRQMVRQFIEEGKKRQEKRKQQRIKYQEMLLKRKQAVQDDLDEREAKCTRRSQEMELDLD